MIESKNKISVIIVNYNVCAFLLNALASIRRALKNMNHEVILVDNASTDGSVSMVRKHFPEVKLIINKKNVGFAAGNNQGLRIAGGNYLVLINPDTVVQEDTFSSLLQFMENNPEAGAATCKILNPDGSFSLDSRHSIPSPMTAFWKQIGFSLLFPKNRVFARYNLTFLDEDDINPVDAISGSFMFIRASAVKDVGPLDENYFMYCEDVDYCYRILKSGWKIYYVPESSIIHYKGESTRKNDLNYVINFNKSLYLFYTKHFQNKYLRILRWLIIAGVFLRGILIYFINQISFYLLCIRRKLHRFTFNINRSIKPSLSKRNVILVCSSHEAYSLARKIVLSSELNLHALITDTKEDIGKIVENTQVITTVDEIAKYEIPKTIDEVIFSAQNISYKMIIFTITNLRQWQGECKIIPPDSDLIVGKANVMKLTKS